MKDKIKVFLGMVLWTVNSPFFIARFLIMFIPMVFAWKVADYADQNDRDRFVASMLLAMLLSGPIGTLIRAFLWEMYEIDDACMRDRLIENLRKKRHK